jgi:hypothetical protein
LGYEDALLAIDLLVEAQLATLGWEAWVKYPDGRHGYLDPVTRATWRLRRRDETWEELVDDAAAFCRRAVEREHQESSEKPIYTGKSLYFCISAVDR